MAENTADDVYDDPDNILADMDSSVDGAVELPEHELEDESQSIFKPELGNDDRGVISELEGVNQGDSDEEMSDHHPLDADTDSNALGDVNPADEQDGTEA